MVLWALILLLFCLAMHGPRRDAPPRSRDTMRTMNAKNEDASDYQIYEMIDTMQALTKHRTFYDLLEVTPTATSDEISRRFRSVSRHWHPDKNDTEEAKKMYTLMTSISALLRSDAGRKGYEWILHEAPAWHKSSYLVRKFVRTSKLSIPQVLLLCSGIRVAGTVACAVDQLLCHHVLDMVGEKSRW